MNTEFRGVLEEWLKDHRLFTATLEELGGQLAVLQPPQQAQGQAPRPSAVGSSSSSSGGGDERKELLERLMQRAPSEQLRAYVEGRPPPGRLQRTLPEQLDQNMRLLSILAAEMRVLLQRLEQLADAAAVQGRSGASGSVDAATADSASAGEAGGAAIAGQDMAAGPADAEEALLLAAVADGASKETLLIANAAAGITLTTSPEEVSAAASVLQLQPFLTSTLLAAVREAPVQDAAADQPTS
ncbi:hypothetical protein C2E21_1526 [Chlorella sorokiniana]|uniref:Uncharacterized protein n=1 Tax=Chlorella sorokiniana TaxID=3076 RepID=A0A2P6U0T0_CHLSO|nr:hypothetical protein C2E21_1526 [Chlorella sorokiniana]|eukprot:PRW59919.1 hypothetical protein C2E21_1526 [Chlorella sorokiniana]